MWGWPLLKSETNKPKLIWGWRPKIANSPLNKGRGRRSSQGWNTTRTEQGYPIVRLYNHYSIMTNISYFTVVWPTEFNNLQHKIFKMGVLNSFITFIKYLLGREYEWPENLRQDGVEFSRPPKWVAISLTIVKSYSLGNAM